MRMFNIHGEFVNVDVRQSSYPIRSISKSKLQGKVGEFLKTNFARNNILEEFFIPGSKLSIDFFISDLGIVIEIQGKAHDKYIPFFHGNNNKCGFGKQLSHDRRKREWSDLNNFKFIEIRKEEDITEYLNL